MPPISSSSQLWRKLCDYTKIVLGFSKDTTPKEFWKGLIYAVLLALAIRTIVAEPFKIPSGSMHPTLIEGDFILVNKNAYGYSRHSLPFSLPLFDGRIFESIPQRGHVVVFKPPHRMEEYWIKRVVGLPGDRVQMKEGHLYINGELVNKEPLPSYNLDMWNDPKGARNVPQYQEHFSGESEDGHHMVQESPVGTHWLDQTGVFHVPEGHYFVMGDNRSHSADSRVPGGLGFVPAENLVGRAFIIFFSTDAALWQVWRWITGIRYNRLMNLIQ